MQFSIGKIICGDPDSIRGAVDHWNGMAVDERRTIPDKDADYSQRRTTIAEAVSAEGVGTFTKSKTRKLVFKPTDRKGWWFQRTDVPCAEPIPVCADAVLSANSNIVLQAPPAGNTMRMVEHIIALKPGLGIDDLVIETDSADPPLFDDSSLPLVRALETAGVVEKDEPAEYTTVSEPITFGGDNGNFLTLIPADAGTRKLTMDVAIDWNTVLGKQRIVFDLTSETAKYGAGARTNATHRQMVLAKTIGLFNKNLRSMGYTRESILIHGKRGYYSIPRKDFDRDGRSFEAVWHRAVMDYLAALALIPGRFIGTAVSYKGGHDLDCRFMKAAAPYFVKL